MKTLAILLVCYSSYAQKIPSDFKVVLKDTALIKVIRKYTSTVLANNSERDRTVLILTSHSITGNPEKEEWSLGATSSQKALRTKIPLFVSEIDNYPIIINFPGNTDRFIKYPDTYLNFVEEFIFSRFNRTNNSSIEKSFGGWRITFIKGKDPIIMGSL